jgi:16S rRNA (guanine966-N2)-methyltransferase
MITIRSGKFKNKRLGIPPAGVRPTSDKIRQAVFNVLMHTDLIDGFSLVGANVLDAFAGTGAMGLEALSRGAAHGWFMEKDSAVRKVLEQNIAMATNIVTLIAGDAQSPPTAPGPMQIVFMDPPYEQHLLGAAIPALAAQGWITDKTLLVIETKKGEAWQQPGSLTILDARSYGNTEINFATFSRK